ncbi:MAG: ABC-F family ATP-binding cassette domain-containing protein, partial [Dichotomicrobium sp.]
GDRLCLVGRNGSGKSTLMKIAAGLTEPDAGERFVQPGATVRYLPQEPDMAGHATVLAYVEAGLAPGDDPHVAARLLEQLGLDGNADPSRISGGEGRRAALARTLAPRPDVLLLDEPTNHLDLPAIEWLESWLKAYRGALVLISHDRRFLENLSRACVWIDRGRTRRIDIGFSGFEDWRDQQLAEEERERHKLNRKIAREEDWLRYGVTARRKRNTRRLAELQAMRQARRAYRGVQGQASISATEADKSGDLVVEAKNVAKSFGDTLIVRDLSLKVRRGDRLGVIGPNGSGKTTLVKLLTGELAPDSGEVRLGANLAEATLEQDRAQLDPEASLKDAMTRGGSDMITTGGQTRHVAAYMKDFLFTPEQMGTPLRVLSGGERARLMIARAMATPSNLLVLDEPTNDLDLDTLDVLQDMLGDYAGTVILISHDRDFLDRIVGSVLAPEGGGVWREYAGGYSDMLAQRGADLAPNGSAPGKSRKDKNAVRRKPRPEASNRLSYKQKHALETLPREIERLRAEARELEARLADPGLYARDRSAFEAATARLGEVHDAIAQAEERWLELEIKREELGNS